MSVSQSSDITDTSLMPAKRHKKSALNIKPSMVAIYAGVFALIIAIVSIGYREPQKASTVVNAVSNNNESISKIPQTSVDDVVATSIASVVAQTANLSVATSVTNLAISAQAKSEFTQSDSVSATKPQIIESSGINRSVVSYTTEAGDTVDTLATKFGVSQQTIKWANDLTTDALSVGKVLNILPVDGVIYDVKDGDTVDSIATKYNVDKTRLVLYNDLDISGISPNTSIILPSAVLPEDERPGYVAPVIARATNYYYGTYGTGFGGQTWNIGYGTPDNGLYTHGNCTLYSYNRRKALGLPVGDHWGNAGSWAQLAASDGLQVDHTPSAGAIIQDPGHVAIVESILANGDLSISEMNAYVPGGGYNVISGRIILSGNVGQYWYIH